MVLDAPATASAVTYMLSGAPTVAATVSGTPNAAVTPQATISIDEIQG